MGPKKKWDCKFNKKWLEDDKYREWIQATLDSGEAYCNFCRCKLNIKSRGIGMLNDHMKTAGHQLNAKKSFKQAKLPFGKSSSSSSSDVSPTTSVTVPESPSEPLFVDVSNNTSNTSTSAQTPPTAASSSSSSSCLPSWPSVSSIPITVLTQ